MFSFFFFVDIIFIGSGLFAIYTTTISYFLIAEFFKLIFLARLSEVILDMKIWQRDLKSRKNKLLRNLKAKAE